jgi:hypothetical protein
LTVFLSSGTSMAALQFGQAAALKVIKTFRDVAMVKFYA